MSKSPAEKECKECKESCPPNCACDCHHKSISPAYFGYLVGQTREVLEATISDKVQLKALSGVMCDRMYGWWNGVYDEYGSRRIT